MSNAYPEIIGIGSTVYDTLMVVDRYPTEDTKLEDLETKVQGGRPLRHGRWWRPESWA